MNLAVKVDPDKTRVKHLRQLEREQSWSGITAWFVEHAGIKESDFDELTLAEVRALSRQVQEELASASLPKATASNS